MNGAEKLEKEKVEITAEGRMAESFAQMKILVFHAFLRTSNVSTRNDFTFRRAESTIRDNEL